jgi:hypothetical protein
VGAGNRIVRSFGDVGEEFGGMYGLGTFVMCGRGWVRVRVCGLTERSAEEAVRKRDGAIHGAFCAGARSAAVRADFGGG